MIYGLLLDTIVVHAVKPFATFEVGQAALDASTVGADEVARARHGHARRSARTGAIDTGIGSIITGLATGSALILTLCLAVPVATESTRCALCVGIARPAHAQIATAQCIDAIARLVASAGAIAETRLALRIAGAESVVVTAFADRSVAVTAWGV